MIGSVAVGDKTSLTVVYALVASGLSDESRHVIPVRLSQFHLFFR
jgi:hypothetical protein